MKQLWKKLVLCVLTLALCCNLVPMAFAADASYYNVYLEAQGGTCDVMQLYAYKYGSNYRLTSTPTPTMEGYTFNGWFTDIVGGSAIVAGETVFSGEEATVYAQWSPIDQVPTEPTAPADTAAGILERHKGTILIVGGMLVLVAVGLAM